MTVIEELAHIAGSLGPDDQRRLLEVAIQLRQSSTPDLAGIPGADASEAAWKAWRERLGEQQEAALLAEKARLMSLDHYKWRLGGSNRRAPSGHASDVG